MVALSAHCTTSCTITATPSSFRKRLCVRCTTDGDCLKRVPYNNKLACWLVGGLAAVRLGLFTAGPALAATQPTAEAPFAPAFAAADGSRLSLDLLADSSGIISLLDHFGLPSTNDLASNLDGDSEQAVRRPQAQGLMQEAVLGAPVNKRTGLDPAGRPCYSRLLCGTMYVTAATAAE